jgi:formate dehydrogenase major subunit
VFGAGGGTSSYRELEDADVVVLWGSNARETHPIFFHHVMVARRKGARLYVVDPRRTSTARWAHAHLPVQVGTDIPLAHALGRVILEEGLENRAFIQRATTGIDAYREAVEPWTLDRAEAVTGVPAGLLQQLARDWARADRAQLCWTLGITEHHNAVDNVLALINLALLGGHVGRYGCGLNPLRGQNNVQGGGDMGALPHKLTGFQDVEDPAVRARFERAWGASIPPRKGWHLTEMFEAMDRGALTGLYCLGENPAQSEADGTRTLRRLQGLEFLLVQDLFRTRTAELAHVVLPGSASWCESEGTVTSSERRVQRCRKVVPAPEGARDDLWILAELSRRLGRDLGHPTPQALWDELRALSPMHHGMSYPRLEALGGLQWPCPEETHPGSTFLHGRLWEDPVQGPRAPFSPVVHDPPVEALDAVYPLRLTTGRRLDSYNTGVQTSAFPSPLRRKETVDISPQDLRALDLREGERVRISSRRGSVVAPVRVDPGLLPGLVFMTLHFPDEVDTNVLTVDAHDPRSGTAEFKAAAVRIDRLADPDADAAE